MKTGLRILGTQQCYEVAVFSERGQFDEVEEFAASLQKATGQWPNWLPEITAVQQHLVPVSELRIASTKASHRNNGANGKGANIADAKAMLTVKPIFILRLAAASKGVTT